MSMEQFPEVPVTTVEARPSRLGLRVAALTFGALGLAGVAGVASSERGSAQQEVAAGEGEYEEAIQTSVSCVEGQPTLFVDVDEANGVVSYNVVLNGGPAETEVDTGDGSFAVAEGDSYTVYNGFDSDSGVVSEDTCDDGGEETTTTTEKPGTEVCPVDGEYTVKVEVSGNQQSVQYTAPEGFLVDGYCVKAGNDLDFVDVEPDAETITVTDQDDNKDVSHFTVKLVEEEDEETTTTTTAATTTTAPATTTTVPGVTTTTAPGTTTTVPGATTTTAPATTTTVPRQTTTTVAQPPVTVKPPHTK